MTNLDKFSSDVQRAAARAVRDNKTDKLSSELEKMFLEWNRDSGTLAENLAGFWVDNYSRALSEDEPRTAALDRLVSLMALLTGDFDEAMDFPDSEWEEIREIVSAEAVSMDMGRLMEIMAIIVSRGRL